MNNKDIFDLIYENDIDSIKELLNSEIDINIQDVRGWTPLYMAFSYNKIDIIKLLLSRQDVNVNLPYMERRHILNIAIAFDNLEICKLIVSHNSFNFKRYLINSKNYLPLLGTSKFEKLNILISICVDIDNQIRKYISLEKTK